MNTTDDMRVYMALESIKQGAMAGVDRALVADVAAAVQCALMGAGSEVEQAWRDVERGRGLIQNALSSVYAGSA